MSKKQTSQDHPKKVKRLKKSYRFLIPSIGFYKFTKGEEVTPQIEAWFKEAGVDISRHTE